jgi:prolyl 4-hydroxylase
MDRAEIGVVVRERLSAVPGIIRVPVPTLDMFILRDFLGRPECDALIALIDADRKPSRLFSDNPDPAFRTSETCNLDPCDGAVRQVEAKLAALMGIDRACGEFIQGQRYGIGQQYKAHHDFLRTSAPYWRLQETIGGQRTWTVMVFLNVPEAGGRTFFPRAKMMIPPRLGSLVAWNNLDTHGEPNPVSLHQGMPVTAGVKYIITKWYRERPWGLRSGGGQPDRQRDE